MRFAFLLLIASLPLTPARADTDIRVGVGAGCSPVGSNIQAAIDAATPALGVVNIHIARNASYTGQHLDINGKNVRLIGGYADCQQTTPDATRTILSGAGGGSDSVITIRGSSQIVALRNLDITGGDEVTTSSGYGGGVDVRNGPHAMVHLENVRLHDNDAGFGGGMSIVNDSSSNQAAINVVFDQNNLIADNLAQAGGGGIYCRDATLDMTRPNTVIYNNVAGSQTSAAPGGGLRLVNCAVRIATRHPLLGTVTANTAWGSGGGISITGERAHLDLYNLLPSRPTSIALNTAAGVGGGLDIGSTARVRGYDIIIDGNTSRSGGGGAATFDNDGTSDDGKPALQMQGLLTDAPAGAVNCAPDLDCNRISNNMARSDSGVDQGGAAVRCNGVRSGPGNSGQSGISLLGTRLNRNTGRSAVHLPGDFCYAYFDGLLIDNNVASADLIHNADGSLMQSTGLTIANNDIADAVIRTTSPLVSLRRSLVWQPGRPLISLVDGPLSAASVEYVVANNLTNAPSSGTNRIATLFEVAFVDAAAGDFRVQAGSLALDYAPPVAGHTRDAFARNVDIPQDANDFGSQDVGAYEKPSADGYNSAPSIAVAGPLSIREDVSPGTFALQGFSLSDPDGNITGALTVTTPVDRGELFGLYFGDVVATQLAANSIVIEGPIAQITEDTAAFAGFAIYNPPPNFFGSVPIALSLSDQGNHGLGGALTAAATLMVQVLPVNDAPTLHVDDILRSTNEAGSSQTVELEAQSTINVGPANESSQIVLGWGDLVVDDVDGVLAALPTLGPGGKLSFMLSGQPGNAAISVRITDDGGTDNGGVDRSAPAVFQLRVSANAAALFSDGFEGPL